MLSLLLFLTWRKHISLQIIISPLRLPLLSTPSPWALNYSNKGQQDYIQRMVARIYSSYLLIWYLFFNISGPRKKVFAWAVFLSVRQRWARRQGWVTWGDSEWAVTTFLKGNCPEWPNKIVTRGCRNISQAQNKICWRRWPRPLFLGLAQHHFCNWIMEHLNKSTYKG